MESIRRAWRISLRNHDTQVFSPVAGDPVATKEEARREATRHLLDGAVLGVNIEEVVLVEGLDGTERWMLATELAERQFYPMLDED